MLEPTGGLQLVSPSNGQDVDIPPIAVSHVESNEVLISAQPAIPILADSIDERQPNMDHEFSGSTTPLGRSFSRPRRAMMAMCLQSVPTATAPAAAQPRRAPTRMPTHPCRISLNAERDPPWKTRSPRESHPQFSGSSDEHETFAVRIDRPVARMHHRGGEPLLVLVHRDFGHPELINVVISELDIEEFKTGRLKALHGFD